MDVLRFEEILEEDLRRLNKRLKREENINIEERVPVCSETTSLTSEIQT